MIKLYRALWFILSPLLLLWLGYRAYKGKEDLNRFGERFGFAASKKDFALKDSLIWIHAASVGESMIALNLAAKLSEIYTNYNILITSGTVTSSKLVKSRKAEGTFHQFIPLDEYFSVKRFFETWKPKLGIIVESEIWPNLLDVGAQYCPIISVNAIISDKSFNRWMGHRTMANYCFSKFAKILCQSERDAIKFSILACGLENNENVHNIGNLKYAAPKPVVDKIKLTALREEIKLRPVFLAASTHSGDEDLVCQTHQALKKQYPDLLTIIAPRHSVRLKSIEQIMDSYKLNYKVRSRNENIDIDTDIYMADTMGELGLLFSLAHVTLIGGSFKNGGHNPIEPAFFNNHIVFGPDMSNFKDITKEFLANKAAKQIFEPSELIKTVSQLLKAGTSENPQKVLANHDKVMDNYMTILTQYIK